MQDQILNAQSRLNKKLSLHMILEELYTLFNLLDKNVSNVAIIRGYHHFYSGENDMDCPFATKTREIFKNEMLEEVGCQIDKVNNLFQIYKKCENNG